VEELHSEIGRFEFPLENPVIDGQSSFFQRVVDGIVDLVHGHGFGQIVIGSASKAVQRCLQIERPCYHDYTQVVMIGDEIVENHIAVTIGETDIKENQSYLLRSRWVYSSCAELA